MLSNLFQLASPRLYGPDCLECCATFLAKLQGQSGKGAISKGSIMKGKLFKIGTLTAVMILTIFLVGCEPESPQSSSSSSYSAKSYSSSSPSPSKSSDDYSKSTSSRSSSKSSSSSSKKETGSYYDTGTGSTMYKYSDGSSEITDGWGNVWRDNDGDGDPDEYSTDGAKSWKQY